MIKNDKTNEAIENYLKVDDLNDVVNDPAVVVGTKLIIPVLGGIALETARGVLKESIAEKQKELMDSIMNDSEIVLKDIPDQIAFIHDFNRVNECIAKLKSNQKIKYFVNILKSEYKKDNKVNRAEDFIDLLNGITYEALTVLAKLYLYETKNNIKTGALLSDVNVYWRDFINSCMSYNEGLTENIIYTHLSILQSKGLCREFNGSYMDYAGGVYRITEYGYLFIKSINNYQFEKEFIDPKDEIYETLKAGAKPDINKYGIVKYYNYLKVLEREGKLRLSEPINVLNAPCAQYKVLEVY